MSVTGADASVGRKARGQASGRNRQVDVNAGKPDEIGSAAPITQLRYGGGFHQLGSTDQDDEEKVLAVAVDKIQSLTGQK